MRAILAHAPGVDVRLARQAVLGAGVECAADDCVAWADLPVRLARGGAQVVIVCIENHATLDWDGLREAIALAEGPVVALGPTGQAELVARARQIGITQYLDEPSLRNGLDRLVESLSQSGSLPRQRGKVISVFAPAPGSGGSTVAANLAGALAGKNARRVGLVELARDPGDLALLLNVTPQHTAGAVCQRWQVLDSMSLGNSFLDHPGGLRALVNGPDQGNAFLVSDAVRRIAVLSRMLFGATVLALDSRLGAEEAEAMRLSDAVVLVVRADVPGVRRVQAALQGAIAQGVPAERFRMVVNRWGQSGQLGLKQIESTLGLAAVEQIPDDPGRCNRAANHGSLLCEMWPRAPICRRFARLAELVEGM